MVTKLTAKRMVQEVNMDTDQRMPVRLRFWAGEVAEVSLVSAPNNPEQALARAIRGYTGNYEDHPCTSEEISAMFQDLKSTKLGTPAEFLHYIFLIRDVPRSFTHQIVRTRLASVVQESTRFIGARDVYNVLVPGTMMLDPETPRPEYVYGTIEAIGAYIDLVDQQGVASQDARNILPHSLLTHLFWSIGLKSLMAVYEQRWCCQAEPSTWLPIMRQIKQLIKGQSGTRIASFLSAPINRGEPCGYNASFDRPCVWKKNRDLAEV